MSAKNKRIGNWKQRCSAKFTSARLPFLDVIVFSGSCYVLTLELFQLSQSEQMHAVVNRHYNSTYRQVQLQLLSVHYFNVHYLSNPQCAQEAEGTDLGKYKVQK